MSLTCICCKTLEHIIVSNINKHYILADCQHGFRGQRSCETQLVQFCRDLVGGLGRAVGRGHGRTDVVVVDFAGAFGRVPHGGVVVQTWRLRDWGSARGWIDSWLSGRSRGVVLDGRASGPVPVLSGVPQGSVLGPVLFLIFIDGLPDGIGSSVRLFAGGCVLCGNVGSPLDCRVLQDGLGGLAGWEVDWQMGFSVGGCRSVEVARLHPGGHVDFGCTLRRRALGRVRSAGCLGLAVTDGLDWGRRISGIACGAAGALGFLRRGLALAPRRAGGGVHARRWFGLGLGVRLLFGVPVVGLGFGGWRGCGGCCPVDLQAMEEHQ
ncbi:MAG: reverse transcriptase domain-containing protein [Candidatus Thiodiazotropha sp.]